MADSPGKEKTAAAVTFEGFNLIEIPCTDVDLQTVQADQLAAYENAVHDQQRRSKNNRCSKTERRGTMPRRLRGRRPTRKVAARAATRRRVREEGLKVETAETARVDLHLAGRRPS